MTLLARFEAKYLPEPNSGCWLWTGSITRHGYGNFNYPDGTLAHRAAFSLLRGPIPPGMAVCHRCDMPACVNPEHLFIGTHAENMQDMFRKGRRVGKVGMPGARHWNAKLSAEDVAAIRASRAPQLETAARYGISRNYVSRLCQGDRWKTPE